MQDIRVNDTENGNPGIRKGTIYLVHSSSITSDISDAAFFDIDYRFLVDHTYGRFGVVYPGTLNYSCTLPNLQQNQEYPNVWSYVDTLSKSTWSTILADLGQAAEPTILTNATVLQLFIRDLGAWTQDHELTANAWPGPATQDYNSLKSETGPLSLSPAVIMTKYICQTPQLKSTGNLIVSILVADLVLLQTAWVIFKLLVGYFCIKRESSSECTCAAESHHAGSSHLANADLASSDTEMAPLRARNKTKRVPFHRRTSSQQNLVGP
jgi:hypothetical protein